MRRFFVMLGFGLGLILLPAGAAAAADFTVDDSGDAVDANPGNGVCATAQGKCTLRAAVNEAEALSGTDAIKVPAMTIALGSPLKITRSVQISGAGARATALTGTPGNAVEIGGGDVVIQDLAIRDIEGTYLLAVRQNGNASSTLRRVRIVNNIATAFSQGYAPVTVTAGELTISDSEISGNQTKGGFGTVYGSGLYVTGATTQVTVSNSTIHGNRAWTQDGSTNAVGGGLVVLAGAKVTVSASTVTANSAQNLGSLAEVGGNIYQNASTVTLTNSVVADGSAYSGANCQGPITSTGKNIVSDDTCGVASANLVIADPKLGQLANNGGPTNTRSPALASPVLNAAPTCSVATDQRGQGRPIGAGCDIGSVELGADVAIKASVSNNKPAAGSDVVFTAVVTNNGMDAATSGKATVALPGAQSIVSVTSSAGTCTRSGTTAQCSLGTVQRGTPVTILIVARAGTSGTIAATATVSSALPDQKPANNTAKVSATVPSSGTVTPVTSCSNLIRGTKKADKLRGTAAGDKILGLGRNDVLKGLSGNDCLKGAKGKDRITGGKGTDQISGGPGADRIRSKDGVRDVVKCGAGRDRVVADRIDAVAKDCEKVQFK